MERSGNGPTDGMWQASGEFPPGGTGDPGVTAADGRPFVGAILRRARAGVPRRGLPGRFGKWNSISRRYRRRVPNGVTDRVLRVLSRDLDLEHPCVDGAVTRAHRKAAEGKGALGERRRTLRRRPGRQGHPVDTVALPGRAHDLKGLPVPMEGRSSCAPVGDGALDADRPVGNPAGAGRRR